MKRFVLISLLAGCQPPCEPPVYVQTFIFQSASGEVLSPLRLEDLETKTRYECTQLGVEANPGSQLTDCSSNRVRITRSATTTYIVRAEAVSGQRFAGGVMPALLEPETDQPCALGRAKDVVLELQ
ncbi:MAG: hypothetical protein ACO1OB_14560 [Archangium sp.]